MSPAGLALLVFAAGYAGFQWTVRVVVYPQMTGVGPAEFAAYERRHQQRVSIAVGPLFAGLGISCLVALASEPGPLTVLACAVFAGVLGLTVLGAVPAHARLARGFDAATHRRLLAVDSGRVLLAVVEVVVAVLHVRG